LPRGGLAAGGQQDGVCPTSGTLGGRSHQPPEQYDTQPCV
jgi:hypothetical protein